MSNLNCVSLKQNKQESNTYNYNDHKLYTFSGGTCQLHSVKCSIKLGLIWADKSDRTFEDWLGTQYTDEESGNRNE